MSIYYNFYLRYTFKAKTHRELVKRYVNNQIENKSMKYFPSMVQKFGDVFNTQLGNLEKKKKNSFTCLFRKVKFNKVCLELCVLETILLTKL